MSGKKPKQGRLAALAGVVLLVLLAVSSVLVPTAAAQDNAGPRLTVVTPVINVRSGPGTNYGVVDALRQGAEVEVMGQNHAAGWWQVKLPSGATGWVSGAAGLVTANSAAASAPEVAAPPPTAAVQAGAARTGSGIAGASSPAAGKTIVFQPVSAGPIYVINSNGTGLRYLTTGIDPALSPDGKQVAFTRWLSSGNGTPGNLWVINIDGTGERKIADMTQPKSPTWSPDGKQIVVNMQRGGVIDPKMMPVSPSNLPEKSDEDLTGCFVGPNDGPGDLLVPCRLVNDPWWFLRAVNVADGSMKDLASDNHSFAPAWNPTNDWQVTYHARNGLASADVKQSTTWQVTKDPNDRDPVYSPDGTKLAIAYHQGDHWEIYTMNPDGSGRVRLTQTPVTALADAILKGHESRQWNNAAPAWSPDGKQIAFITDRTGQWEFWVMNADGRNQRPLFPAGALAGVNLQYNAVDERMLSWR